MFEIFFFKKAKIKKNITKEKTKKNFFLFFHFCSEVFKNQIVFDFFFEKLKAKDLKKEIFYLCHVLLKKVLLLLIIY